MFKTVSKRIRILLLAMLMIAGIAFIFLVNADDRTHSLQAETVEGILANAQQSYTLMLDHHEDWTRGKQLILDSLEDSNDEYFQALLSGKSIRLNNRRIELEALDNNLIVSELSGLQSIWRRLKNRLDSLPNYPLLRAENRSVQVDVATSDSTSVKEVVAYEVTIPEAEFKSRLSEVQVLMSSLQRNGSFLRLLYLDQGKASADGQHYLLITLMGFWLLSVVFFWLLIQKYVNGPLHRLLSGSRKMAAGENQVDFGLSGDDEFAQLGDQLTQIGAHRERAVQFMERVTREQNMSAFATSGEDDHLGQALNSMQTELQELAAEDIKRNWSTTGLAKFSEILRSDADDLNRFGTSIISELVRYMQVNQGGLYMVKHTDGQEDDVSIELLASYAFDREKFLKQTLLPGESLVGQCYLEEKTIYLSDVPENYITITSGMGDAPPDHVLIVPLMYNEEVHAILEVASFKPIPENQVEFVEKLGESIASTISSVQNAATTKRLLEESQAMTESIQSQEEEMRQNLEELQATQEEMGRKQQEMNAINQRFEMLEKSAEEGYWDVQFDQRITDYTRGEFWCSERYKHLLENDNFSGDLNDFFAAIDAADRDEVKQAWNSWCKASDQDELQVEFKINTTTEEAKVLRLKGIAIRHSSGEPKRLTGILKLIS